MTLARKFVIEFVELFLVYLPKFRRNDVCVAGVFFPWLFVFSRYDNKSTKKNSTKRDTFNCEIRLPRVRRIRLAVNLYRCLLFEHCPLAPLVYHIVNNSR